LSKLHGETFNLYGEGLEAFFSHPEIAKIFVAQYCRVSLTSYGLKLAQEVGCTDKKLKPLSSEDKLGIKSQSFKKASNIGINQARRGKKRAAKESLSDQHHKKPRIHIHDLSKTIITPEV